MIYFLQHGRVGPIKIGHTEADVAGRVRQLQNSAPEELVFLGVHAGDRHVERELHDRFSAYRYRGEWFEPNLHLLQHIERNAVERDLGAIMRVDLRAAVSRSARKHWPREIKQKYRPRDFAPAMRVSRWEEGMGAPPKQLVSYIEEFLTKHEVWPDQVCAEAA